MKADLIFVIIVFLSSWIGYKKGFINSVINLLFVMCSSVGCYLMYPVVAEFIMDSFLGDKITGYFAELLSEKLPYSDTEGYMALLMKYNAENFETLIAKMSEMVSTLVVNIVSALLVFIAIRILFVFVKGVFGFISKLPVIRSVNGVLGALVCVASSLLVVFLFFAVILSPVCKDSEFSYEVCKEVDNSYIAKNVMNYNIFINYDTTKSTFNEE